MTPVCAVLFFATLLFATLVLATPAYSQEKIDIAVGGGTLFSAASNGVSEAFLPASQRGGVYPSVSFNALLRDHLGFNVETSWRYHEESYYGYEKYRPFFADANLLYQRAITKKVGIDLLAGAGFDSTRFDLPLQTACTTPSGTCYTSFTHFDEHIGMGVHYYFLRRFFVRPEAHYYHVQDNRGFNTNNVFRVGASIGRTWGQK
jgi:hypothetical protein